MQESKHTLDHFLSELEIASPTLKFLPAQFQHRKITEKEAKDWRRRYGSEPPQFVNTETVQNILQVHIETDGPRRGHWSIVGGKRKWIDGQHNYNRQLDTHSFEPVLGTRLMNKNQRAKEERDADNKITNQIVMTEGVFIQKLGRIVNASKHDGVAAAFEEAKQILLRRKSDWQKSAAKAASYASRTTAKGDASITVHTPASEGGK